jgi:hypothetical protein
MSISPQGLECSGLLGRLLDPEIAIFEELFDADLPVEEQAKHWIAFFSLFDEQDKIALQHILSHKQRLQLEMVVYLSELRTAKVQVNSLLFKKHLSELFYILHCSCHSNSIIFL